MGSRKSEETMARRLLGMAKRRFYSFLGSDATSTVQPQETRLAQHASAGRANIQGNGSSEKVGQRAMFFLFSTRNRL